ncbi:hypothetical protein MKX03_036887 [Papaver bracteatum]|nr:hypothetical protein MKX03_036887 [Papaver bracteatum]
MGGKLGFLRLFCEQVNACLSSFAALVPNQVLFSAASMVNFRLAICLLANRNELGVQSRIGKKTTESVEGFGRGESIVKEGLHVIVCGCSTEKMRSINKLSAMRIWVCVEGDRDV